MPPRPIPAPRREQPSSTSAAQPASGATSRHWDLYRDGISYSSLNKFNFCRHRFWLEYIAGLKEVQEFNHRTAFGTMFDKARVAQVREGTRQAGLEAARAYGQQLRQENPELPLEGLKSPEFWTDLFCRQYALYDAYWSVVEDNDDFRPMLKQSRFDVMYRIPDGREIKLKGYYDEVLQHKKRPSEVCLREDKCLGDPDVQGIQRGLIHEGQTGIYLVALREQGYTPVRAWYNILKRPQGDNHALHWRKGRCVNKKTGERKGADTHETFIDRIMEQVNQDKDQWFRRWPLEVTPKIISGFERTFLQPQLRLLADWWDSIADDPQDPWKSPLHYQMSFGNYNPMGKSGWRGPFWTLLTTGSTVGLENSCNFFPELDRS